MAATSTNKQPLLIDRVLHSVVDLNAAAVGSINIIGTNTAALIVDGTQSDGCILEDIYCISRSTAPQKINLYLSSSFDYLRPNEGIFIGQLTSSATVAEIVHLETLPRILAPMPHTARGGTLTSTAVTVGDTVTTTTTSNLENQYRALYIQKGKTLWAGRQDIAIVNDGPLLGVQGGWY